ncbi:MAG: hypothetical protein EA396_02465 [Anaerolineaceae bacterium]|nr:MAG: hypothetical protein EA396_02465 [Anaerolineaceae bacterium]
MANVTVCANEALLNALVAPYAPFFNGVHIIRALGLQITHRAIEPPRFELRGRTATGPDFVLRVPAFEVSAYRYRNRQRGRHIITRTFALGFTGDFTFKAASADTAPAIGINVTGAEVDGAPFSRRLLRTALNQRILPAIMRQLPRIAIPDLREVVGFAVRVDGLQVANHALYMLMSVAGGGESTPPFIAPEVNDEAGILLSMTAEAITATQADFKVKRGIDEDTDFPLPMGLRLGLASVQMVGFVQADHLRVRVRGGQPTCAVNLSAGAGLRVGLQPLGRVNLSLQPTITPPRFTLDLMSDSQTVYTVIQMESSPLVSWDLPAVPTPIKPILRDLLTGVDNAMSPVYDAVDTGLQMVKIPIASLDGLPLHGAVRYARFEGNGVVVGVALQPPM